MPISLFLKYPRAERIKVNGGPKRFYAFGEDILGTMIKQSVTNICEVDFAVQAGTPMAVNDDDTLA
ncbi:MAG: hypothetical protein KAT26_00145 [Marinosulfonomonas sp.]|nr:hypothetical protein [Marinosulfonomonas sp.]